MYTYGFEIAHGYKVLKGVVDADDEQQAIAKIEANAWDDILDEYDVEQLTIGYEILSIWKV